MERVPNRRLIVSSTFSSGFGIPSWAGCAATRMKPPRPSATATPADPIETTVQRPGGGTVSILETEAILAPTAWRLLGWKAEIAAQPTTAANPITLTFRLDASLLLIPLLGFLPPNDPRTRATVLAIADELTENDMVLRYRVEETDDGLAGEEGTFAICSFWLVSALVEIGEVTRARDLCDKLLSYASPLALYAEEIDPHSGRHLGNFPQAFTHLALINAVMHIIRADEALVEDPR